MLRSSKAEIKYNVTTDFAHLGLHSAAASGDIGLVQYALSHGQPINSVLDGVLPLHAACSGGNDLVVRLLIEHGADVNAPRLPRRYTTDKHRDASVPIVGTSGSTPLHFAAANGHSTVITTLLLYGAHADLPDKHGITPETLARQNGWLECADLLHDWLLNKDKDLKDREIFLISGSSDSPNSCVRRRLQVKRSVDNALHKLKNEIPAPTSPKSTVLCHLDPPSPVSGLPDVTSFLSLEPASNSKHSQNLSPPPLTHSTTSSAAYNKHAFPQRPRSAGNSAETSRSLSPITRKLGTKYSLLHLFKKAQTGGEDVILSAETDMPQNRSDTTFSTASTSASPINVQSVTVSSPQNEMTTSPSSLHDSFSRSSSSRSALDTESREATANPNVVDMQRAMTKQHLRVRSRSGVSGLGEIEDSDHQRHLGSSRNHSRSSSQGQSQAPNPRSRLMLRFDSGSSSNLRHAATQLQAQYDSSSRTNPLGRIKARHSSESLLRIMAEMAMSNTTNSNATSLDLARVGMHTPGDDDDEEYGVPIEHPHFVDSSAGSHFGVFQSNTLPQERSISSSSSSSPLSQNTVGDTFEVDGVTSFIQPSPLKLDEQLLSVPLQTTTTDSRSRGDSVSSMSTNGSTVPQMTSSSTSTTSKSSANLIPAVEENHAILPKSHDLTMPEIGFVVDDQAVPPYRITLGQRRNHTPQDINIRSISSHAQAEALVQRAQQSILEMTDEFNSDDLSSAGLSTGRTPLSAKLAAYGESLAIQRKLKQEEEKRTITSIQGVDDEEDFRPSHRMDLSRPTTASQPGKVKALESGPPRKSDRRLDRKASLEHKMSVRSHSRIVPKRPNTSAGIPSEVASRHFQSRSVSIDDPKTAPLHGVSKHGALEAKGVDEDSTTHVVNTPTQGSPVDTLPEGGGSRPRHIVSANKLTRMGFANTDGRQSGAHGTSPRPRSASGNKVVFGSLKTLMQSLKGRS